MIDSFFKVFWLPDPSQVVDLAEGFRTVAPGPPEASANKSSVLGQPVENLFLCTGGSRAFFGAGTF